MGVNLSSSFLCLFFRYIDSRDPLSGKKPFGQRTSALFFKIVLQQKFQMEKVVAPPHCTN
jgi:hypothetical protein